MWELLLVMLERLGIIVTVAFLVTRFRFVRNIIEEKNVSSIQRLHFILMFGLFGIIGTYTGLTINAEEGVYTRWTLSLTDDEAIANARVIGIVVAGLLGGWKVGIGAGLIAGIHRYTLGGFSALACAISTVLAGLIAGYFYKKYRNHRMVSWKNALLIGMLAEAVQMLIILLIAKPFSAAWALVSSIGVPMIIANGIGTAIFILIIRNVINEEERMGKLQAERSFKLANQTLKYMRKGLNESSAKAACHILFKEINVAAVSITNHQTVLAYVGEENGNEKQEIKTKATKEVLKTGEWKLADARDMEGLNVREPHHSAIIAPLIQNEKPVGTLKLYFKSEKERTPTTIELAKGLAELLSQQLQLAYADDQLKLAKQAEINALEAQVNPHFLFNALNTIVSLIRTDPNKARKLLISLSKFFRQNLTGIHAKEATIKEELNHVKAYLQIEQARFSDRLEVYYEVSDSLMYVTVPPMTLQPLVENAMKHGLKDKVGHCTLVIRVYQHEHFVCIDVEDSGVGISEQRQKELFTQPVQSEVGTGIGLYNMKRRLEMMYGSHFEIKVKSEVEQGATFTLCINQERDESND
ncbi:two-component sensor histidine kinase [Alkalihalophilus pseudofirmus OF4]|uniref:histidine kinase n=1 Tax=Alkalihalophilus pseudofirmus (strain ATCC BAA-2126 / JCM 17055 / OF4) TaxID=398511 RepID=D3FVK1_ALKPO|nr:MULTISPECIES: sensor histidine kinase [Alkalihalophilus]ADC48516.1 two-component sensor histidine kinase [Alkalihalophilus pseudofirmus OF4]MED1600988.1 sensor histidine kinase [Alkalihalophilus marmarensis]